MAIAFTLNVGEGIIPGFHFISSHLLLLSSFLFTSTVHLQQKTEVQPLLWTYNFFYSSFQLLQSSGWLEIPSYDGNGFMLKLSQIPPFNDFVDTS